MQCFPYARHALKLLPAWAPCGVTRLRYLLRLALSLGWCGCSELILVMQKFHKEPVRIKKRFPDPSRPLRVKAGAKCSQHLALSLLELAVQYPLNEEGMKSLLKSSSASYGHIGITGRHFHPVALLAVER